MAIYPAIVSSGNLSTNSGLALGTRCIASPCRFDKTARDLHLGQSVQLGGDMDNEDSDSVGMEGRTYSLLARSHRSLDHSVMGISSPLPYPLPFPLLVCRDAPGRRPLTVGVLSPRASRLLLARSESDIFRRLGPALVESRLRPRPRPITGPSSSS